MKRTILILVLTQIFSLSMVGQVNLRSGLVAHYPFNGNANDESGNAYHGTVNGATLTNDRFGNPNRAYSFNGANNSIYCGNIASMKPESQITLCAWIYVYGSTGTYQHIISKWILNSEWDWVLELRPDGQTPQIPIQGISTDFSSNSASNTQIDFNKWCFVLGEYDGSSVKLFVNGAQTGELQTSGTIHQTDIPLYLGYANGGGAYFNGKIDDVRIYNRVLNDSEIQALYGQTIDSVKKDSVINTKIVSDLSWKTSTTEIAGWNTTDFDDSNWIVPSSRSDVPWSPQSNGYSKDVAMIWSATSADSYMRKTFLIENNVIDSAKIKLTIDDDIQLYINGTLITSDNDCTASGFNLDVKQYLIKGKNVIAVKGHDCGGFQWFCSELNMFSTIPTSVNEISKTVISLFPNPTTSNIQIKGIEGKATLSLFGIDGRLLLTKEFTNNETISVNTLPKGIYMVNINIKEAIVKKMLIKN